MIIFFWILGFSPSSFNFPWVPKIFKLLPNMFPRTTRGNNIGKITKDLCKGHFSALYIKMLEALVY